MKLHRYFALAIGVLGPLALSLPLDAQQPPFELSSTNVEAANTLMALPWPGLMEAKLQPFRKHLSDISGEKFVNTSGNGYEFSLALDNLQLETNAASLAPGIARVPGGFSVRAPLTGGWSFAISGNLLAHAWAGSKTTIGGTTIKTNLIDQNVSVPFRLGINDVWLSSTSGIDTSDATHPKLVSGSVQAHASIAGSFFFPGYPVDLNLVRQADGSLLGEVSLTQGLGIPEFLEVDEGVKLSILLLPFSSDNVWVLVVGLEGAV